MREVYIKRMNFNENVYMSDDMMEFVNLTGEKVYQQGQLIDLK